MKISEFEHKRLRNRIHGYDYSENGWYAITICIHNMIQCFGKVENGIMKLNKWGEIAHNQWEIIPSFYLNIEIDKFVIMPNHMHGIIIINNVVTGQWPVTTTNKFSNYGLISKIVNSYKGIVTKKIHQTGFVNFEWQRSFYDRVIRSEEELLIKQQYILNNPLKWEYDRNNPNRKPGKYYFEL